jgi:hypothetical protein
MRAGWVASVIGHVGAVLMTMLAWEARSMIAPAGTEVVPVEIVDVAAESNVRALAEDVPEEDRAPEEQPETAQARTAEAPQAPRRDRRQQQAELDLDAIARMVNTDTKTGREQQQGASANRNQQGVGLGTREEASLRAIINAVGRSHLRDCWRMPIDLPDPDRLVVTVEFELNRNGTLNGQPRVTNPRNYTYDPAMRAAAEAALRAVRQCDPYPFPDDPRVGEN